MNHPVISNPSRPTKPDRRPLLFLILIVLILSARWIWIAGIGDYGWTYELGMRVSQGEIPFRDYICALPQLTSYTIVPFLALLNGNLWAFSLHLYLWWFATLLVGLQVLRRFDLPPLTQAAAMFWAACLSMPSLHLGHAYSYAGTFFFGLTLLNLMNHRATGLTRHLVLAGVCAGVGIFAKQNIGVVAVLLGLVIVTYDCLMNKKPAALFRLGLGFCIGVASGFFPIFAYFASHAGANEVFQQMFSDAGTGKGGFFGMLFHLIPLFFFRPETPGSQLWTILISGVLALLFLGLIGFKMHRLQKGQTAPTPATPSRQTGLLLVVSLGVVAFLSAISLFDLVSVRQFFNRLHPDAIYPFQGFSVPVFFVTYSFLTALALNCLLSAHHWLKPEYALPIIALPLLLWGHELSYFGYLPFGAPIVIPLAVVLLESTGLMRNTVPLACVAGLLIIAGKAASTQVGHHPPSFAKLEPLPADSKFACLWAEPSYAAHLNELQREVSPRIRDHTTLWLDIGGPHLAWGGKPVYAVATLFADTYQARSEPELWRRWEEQPPEFIYVGKVWSCANSRLLTEEARKSWLPLRYDPIWKHSFEDATLWQLRAPIPAQTNSPSH